MTKTRLLKHDLHFHGLGSSDLCHSTYSNEAVQSWVCLELADSCLLWIVNGHLPMRPRINFKMLVTDFTPHFSIISGKSKWGLSNGGLRPLSAICAQSCTIVHFCGLFGPLSEGNFRHKMTTIVGNRGQLWRSTLSPHLESPHLDFPDYYIHILIFRIN